jgi:hypothetical protein
VLVAYGIWEQPDGPSRSLGTDPSHRYREDTIYALMDSRGEFLMADPVEGGRRLTRALGSAEHFTDGGSALSTALGLRPTHPDLRVVRVFIRLEKPVPTWADGITPHTHIRRG